MDSHRPERWPGCDRLSDPILVVVVDRNPGAARALAAHGIRLHAATTLSALVDELAAAGVIRDDDRDAVVAYLGR